MTNADPIGEYIARHSKWHKELSCLRKILNASELEEAVKWGAPIYTIAGKNHTGDTTRTATGAGEGPQTENKV